MIPILYEGTEKQFLHNGLGRLADAITCEVTEERNGTFELEMTYPITGIHYADIAENRIILAKTEDGGNNQAFIIYKISRPLNGIVTINAQHISYLLSGFVVMPFTASSLAGAMNKINENAVPETPFLFQTNVSSSVQFKLDAPRNIRNLLGGESGSLLDVYGGYDYKFDNFTVYLLNNRGADNGVTIRYGKNMTALKSVVDMTNVYTGIVPYWAGADGVVYLPERVVYSASADLYPYKIVKTVDFTSDFENAPTEAQLRAKAQQYLTSNQGWKLKNNIDVSFVSLAQTDEYKDIAPLERVKLCDTVTIIYRALGINAQTKVVKTVYNVLLERYNTISLGDTTYTLSQALQQTIDAPTMKEVTSYTQSAVDRATTLLKGGLGGYVVFNTDGDGHPQEILIMDSDTKETAINVVRLNKNGIGFSNNGYDGNYRNAWTIDGNLVADFITTGNLNGQLISAESIEASSLSKSVQNELIHNYCAEDAYQDASKWDYGAVAPYNVTLDDIPYLVLNGSGISAWNTNYYVTIPVDAQGYAKFTVEIEFYLDQTVTISSAQSFIFFNFTDEDGSGHQYRTQLAAGTTFTRNTVYTRTGNFEPPYSTDPNKGTPKVGVYFIQNARMYVKSFKVYSSEKTYNSAALTFNSNGLQMLAQTVGNHDYLPFDVMTNNDRWSYQQGHGFVLVAGSAPIHGEYKDAVRIYGTGASQSYDWVLCSCETDLIGTPTITFAFKCIFQTNYTFASNTDIAYIEIRTQSGWIAPSTLKFTVSAGTTMIADRTYEFTKTLALPYAADFYAGKSLLYMRGLRGVDITYYDLEISSDGESYKKASLSYTSDGLNSTVQAGAIISTINQSAEQVSIEADKINLAGNLSLRGQFQAFDVNDSRNYIDMTDGEISIYNQGTNVFTVASTPLLGNRAGIFFGDASDSSQMLARTHIDSSEISVPWLYNRMTGEYESRLGNTDTAYSVIGAVFESSTEFYQNVYYRNDEGGKLSCSMDAYFYGNVCKSDGSIVFVSDRRKKKSIKDLVIDKAKSFIMGLKPKAFKFKKGTSNRYHHGFIAQEVKEAMSEDWGVYVEDKKTDFIGIRYDEFIADMVAVIQDQEKRIDALERKINDITGVKS